MQIEVAGPVTLAKIAAIHALCNDCTPAMVVEAILLSRETADFLDAMEKFVVKPPKKIKIKLRLKKKERKNADKTL